MRIERLIVKEMFPQVAVIRNIKFNLFGINFIVDDTSNDIRDSGNSIGKSTVAKIINLCLGGKSASSLYKDIETKNIDTEIEQYIKFKKVEAELILINANNERFNIVCPLYKSGTRKLNNEKMSKDELNENLLKIIFNTTEEKPTFRQLISKFIRIDTISDERLFKFLSFGKNTDYECIYSFLFKFIEDSLISKKAILEEELHEQTKVLESYKKSKQLQSKELLEQKLIIIDKEIEKLKRQRTNFQYLENFKQDSERAHKLNSDCKTIDNEINKTVTEIKLITEAILEQKKTVQKDDSKILCEIYDEAQSLLKQIAISFSDFVAFHNAMINNKVKFLEEQKNSKETELILLEKKYDAILEAKKNVAIELLDEGLLSEMNAINKQIEDLAREKGEIAKSISIWIENQENINRIAMSIQELAVKTGVTDSATNIVMFNNYFSEYTKKMYNISYFIAYKNEGFPLTIDKVGGVGTGKKKGLISAFDLAYYSFASEKHIDCPKFIIHDKMETTDKKQLEIISNISNDIQAQLIMPILKEKIDFLTADEEAQYVILKLSNEEKFFKVN